MTPPGCRGYIQKIWGFQLFYSGCRDRVLADDSAQGLHHRPAVIPPGKFWGGIDSSEDELPASPNAQAAAAAESLSAVRKARLFHTPYQHAGGQPQLNGPQPAVEASICSLLVEEEREAPVSLEQGSHCKGSMTNFMGRNTNVLCVDGGLMYHLYILFETCPMLLLHSPVRPGQWHLFRPDARGRGACVFPWLLWERARPGAAAPSPVHACSL